MTGSPIQDEHRSNRPNLVAPLVVGLGAVAVLVAAVLALVAGNGPASAPPSQDAEVLEYLRTLEIGDFELVDQDGNPVDRSVLEGGLTVLAFQFTNCKTACPIMSSHLLTLHNQRPRLPIRIVTISVDPRHDTPDALREYADARGIDTSRWVFLTGDEETVRRIAKTDLGFALREDKSNPIGLPGGGTMFNIVHPTKLLLLDEEGQAIGLYDGLTAEGVKQLAADVRAMTSG